MPRIGGLTVALLDVAADIEAAEEQRNPDDEGVAYDVASSLLHHGTLPELSYRAAVKAFGQHGAAELIYLVGLYCLVSVTLNGFNVPVPESEAE